MQQSAAMDPPGIKEGSSEQISVDELDAQWEEGSTSQDSRAVPQQPPPPAASSSQSPLTPGKKKRLFSPKKLMKSIVRRASGTSKSDLAPNSSKEGEEEAKP